MNYLELFKSIEEDIKTHPYLQLTKCKINDGISNLENSKKELYETLGYLKNVNLNSIFEFYKQCDGLVIKWKIASHLSDEEYSRLPKKFPGFKLPYNRESVIGSINILPFEDVFIYEQDYFETSSSENNYIHFGNHIYKRNSFGKLLFVFDLYSDTQCMAFVPDEDNKKPKIIQLLDYYIVWDSSRITYFDSYINFLAATRGLINSKEELIDYYSTYKDQPLIFDTIPFKTEIEPSLFKDSF